MRAVSLRQEKAAKITMRLSQREVESIRTTHGQQARAFVDGHYVDGSGVDRMAGPRARLELTAGLTYQHDNARGDRWIAQARLRANFALSVSSGARSCSISFPCSFFTSIVV